jgi:hypothetical protein
MKKEKSAFPIFLDIRAAAEFNVTDYGMTLRDYFAGQALAGIMAAPSTTEATTDEIAYLSYKIADAIIVEREKTND